MDETVQIRIDGETLPFKLDFFPEERGRWTAARELAESFFPLVVETGGKRFELYSDGTFAEVER